MIMKANAIFMEKQVAVSSIKQPGKWEKIHSKQEQWMKY